ncbi:MAG TPA: DUF3040 domain-containing protein [Streptosporangiaceae bacterium]|nr:DUF3040 domain-containing protein [Streptosporangiaceae bacterium]
MSLPASEARVLTGIEAGLLARDPRFRSLFAIFTRLTRQEAMPTREQLRRTRWRLRPGPVIFIALALVLVGVVLGSLAGPARLCSAAQKHPAAAGGAARSCTPAAGSRPTTP